MAKRIKAERSPALEPLVAMVDAGQVDPKEDSIMAKDKVREIRRVKDENDQLKRSVAASARKIQRIKKTLGL